MSLHCSCTGSEASWKLRKRPMRQQRLIDVLGNSSGGRPTEKETANSSRALPQRLPTASRHLSQHSKLT